MNWRVWQNPWRLMLAVNAAVLMVVFWHKIARPPHLPYIHLLVDYHYGFTKRALIGAAVGLFVAKVPEWLVFALGGAAWLITAGLFVQLFRRTFGFEAKNLPLFVLLASSPYFLKNFLHTLGHFDIYGCLLAIILLLIPARSMAYVLLAALFSAILIMIHHLHLLLLLYVPTIVVIVVLRHYLVQGVDRLNAAIGAGLLAAIGMLCIAEQFYGTVAVPEAEFVTYLHSRMADPSRNELLSFSYVWYRSLAEEVWQTWRYMPFNLLGIPAYSLLLLVHVPVWRYSVDLIAALRHDMHRRVVIAGAIAISIAYLVLFAIVFDYSRWVANWSVCLFLILHAVKALPAERDVAPIPADDRKTIAFGWIVTLIPRVGVIRPY
jgi:hypothetical protein